MTRYREVSDFAKHFAAEFKGFMKANSITNLQLADRLGRNDGYISERANGKRPLDADDVDALASLVEGWTGRDLMIELARRVRVGLAPSSSDSSAAATPNLVLVGGMTDDELSNIDLSRGDYALAATHDTSAVLEQSHPDYEDENQDPEG